MVFGINFSGVPGALDYWGDQIGSALGTKAPPKVDPYNVDPAGRNAAIEMLGQGPRGVPTANPFAPPNPALDRQRQQPVKGAPGGAGGGSGPVVQVTSGLPGLLGDYRTDRARLAQTRTQQLAANEALRGAALGTAPSVAELQLRAGQDQLARNNLALANSGRGNNAMAIRAAQNANVIGGQQMNQQAAALRAGEMAQARGQWSGALAGLGQQDIAGGAQSAEVARAIDDARMRGMVANQGAGLQYAGLGLQARGMDDDRFFRSLQGIMGYDTLGQEAALAAQGFDATGRLQAAQNRANLWGGGLNAIGGWMAKPG